MDGQAKRQEVTKFEVRKYVLLQNRNKPPTSHRLYIVVWWILRLLIVQISSKFGIYYLTKSQWSIRLSCDYSPEDDPWRIGSARMVLMLMSKMLNRLSIMKRRFWPQRIGNFVFDGLNTSQMKTLVSIVILSKKPYDFGCLCQEPSRFSNWEKMKTMQKLIVTYRCWEKRILILQMARLWIHSAKYRFWPLNCVQNL